MFCVCLNSVSLMHNVNTKDDYNLHGSPVILVFGQDVGY